MISYDRFTKNMMMQINECRVFIKSYGCQMNVYDSEKMSDLLAACGCSFVDNYADADIVILNTCCIREKAEDKLFSDIGRIRPYREKANMNGRPYIIAVTGCISQIRREQIAKRCGCVDIILGPQMIQHIVTCIKNCLDGELLQVLTKFNSEEKFELFAAPRKSQSVSAFVTIQEGCNNFCTYCIVPHTRGREISRPAVDIIEEINKLVDSGVKEVTLCGQNVNSYSYVGNDDHCSFAELLRRIAGSCNLRRLRYTTSHPKDISDALLEVYRDINILMPFLHLPVQSGSDRILKSMNRGYTAEEYLMCIDRLRTAKPDIAFSSDFIVGFPGETDEDFQATIDLVNRVGYAQAYSFKYSPRPNTPAALMDNQIEESIKEERLAVLQDLLNEQQVNYNATFVGKETGVLIEKPGRHENQLGGRTPYGQAVSLLNSDGTYAIGDVVNVRIIENLSHSLVGEILNAE